MKNWLRLSVIALISLTSFISRAQETPTAETVNGEIAEQVDARLSELTSDGFAGVFLVALNGEVMLRKGYGLADRVAELPNTPDTIHAIGSIAKSFTKLAVYKLIEDSLLDLDAPISTYLDDVPTDKAGITVQQLLDHTSGLPHALNRGAVSTEALTRDQTLAAILAASLQFDPGTGELYSNPGYTLLAILVELESGQPFTTYIREQFLDPIGMTNTFFWGEDLDGRPEASYSNAYTQYGKASEWPDSWKLQGAGTMLSTVDDLYRFHQAVLTDPFISSVIPSRGGLGEAGGASFASFSADYEYLEGQGDLPSIVVIGLSNGDEHPAEQVTLDKGGLLDMIIEAVTGRRIQDS